MPLIAAAPAVGPKTPSASPPRPGWDCEVGGLGDSQDDSAPLGRREAGSQAGTAEERGCSGTGGLGHAERVQTQAIGEKDLAHQLQD